MGYSIRVITGDSKSLDLGSNPSVPTMENITTQAGVFRISFIDGKEYIGTANNIQKKISKLGGFLKDKGEYEIHIEETADSFTDKELSALELKYIKQYNTEEPNGYNKALTKAKPKEPDDYVHYNRMKFYFYQPGKDTYHVSIFYYPTDLVYFDIPEGETLKTMIESGKIYMSNSEELIKNIMQKWIQSKKD